MTDLDALDKLYAALTGPGRECGDYVNEEFSEACIECYPALAAEIRELREAYEASRDTAIGQMKRGNALFVENESLRARVAELEGALQTIANGDPSNVHSPIGPLHAAGIVFQWEIDAKIARAALTPPGEKP